MAVLRVTGYIRVPDGHQETLSPSDPVSEGHGGQQLLWKAELHGVPETKNPATQLRSQDPCCSR